MSTPAATERHPGAACALVFCGKPHREVARCLAAICAQAGLPAHVHPNDVATATEVFKRLQHDEARPVLVVFGGGKAVARSALSCTAADWEDAWRTGCQAGALIGQQAIAAMAPHGTGTLVFLGDLSATGLPAVDAAQASASAGLRSFAQSMARGHGPQGLHIAHLMLGGGAYPGDRPDPAGVAAACWQLHQQDPSTWTHEMDLRSSAQARTQAS